jgi:hypothetical protein
MKVNVRLSDKRLPVEIEASSSVLVLQIARAHTPVVTPEQRAPLHSTRHQPPALLTLRRTKTRSLGAFLRQSVSESLYAQRHLGGTFCAEEAALGRQGMRGDSSPASQGARASKGKRRQEATCRKCQFPAQEDAPGFEQLLTCSGCEE